MRRTPWFGVTGLLLLATLLAAVFVQVRQHALLTLTVQDQDDYAVLSLYQLEVEYLRLREQLRRVESDADHTARAELQLRYDIFLSRVDLLRTVRARRLLGHIAGSPATTHALDGFIVRAEVYLGADAGSRLGEAAAMALLAELELLGEPIHQLLLDASHQVAAQITARRDQVRQHNEVGLALTVFLSAMVLVFAGIALRQMRQLEQRRQHLETLADQLRDARITADSANAAKTAFLADMSHELRTPLHGLLGMLGLVKAAPRDPRAGQWLATADDSAIHLQRLLDDVLDLSKLESGMLTLVPQTVALAPLVHESCALMRLQADAKGLRLEASVDADLPERVRLDPTRTRQVLFNLLHNAIKYSETGKVVLRCRQVVGEHGTPLIEFDVADSGIGMDAEALAQLFQRFSRAEDPLARGQGGAGLGLAISRNLAQLMGGSLVVRSTPGAGSVFSFRCALLPAAEPAATPGAAPVALGRSLRVLVAEDHPVNRLYLGALLERMGHLSRHVENGQEAVQAIREQRFDLVLMDVHMPVMDGVAATTAIRALPILPLDGAQPRIVALTADVFADTRERCLHAGADEVITKPVSAASLAELLQRHFGVSVQPHGGSAPGQPSLSPGLALIDHSAQAGVRQAMGEQRSLELYAGLFEQANQATQRMREAMREADIDALRQQAHAIKGASLNLGLPALAGAAATLSSEAQAMGAAQLALAVQRFAELVQATRALCAAEGLIVESVSDPAT